MAQEKAIKILHVDDDIFEQELVSINLNRLADDLKFEWADSGPTALEKLQELSFDLIISDYQMPEMTGLEFLVEMKNRGYDIPLIFITGQGNEKLAAEAFRAGAFDYFTKEESFAHYDRLLNSIRRAHGIYTNNREYRLAEENYRKLYENAIAGVFQTTLQGKLVRCNKAFKKMLGYAPSDDIRGIDVKQWYKDKSKRIDYVEEITRLGKINNFELSFRSRYGKDVWLLNNAVLLDNGIIQGTVIDITDRKLAEVSLERSEDKLKQLVDFFPVSVQIYDLEGTLLNANKAWGELWQSEEYKSNFGVYNILKDPQLQDSSLRSAFLEACRGKTVDMAPFVYDPSLSNLPGPKRTLLCRLYPLNTKSGNIENIVIAAQILDRPESEKSGDERKQKEKSRERSAEVSRCSVCVHENGPVPGNTPCDMVINNTADIIFIKNSEGTYLRVNDALLKLLNLRKSEIVGKKDDALFDEKTIKEITEDDHQVLHGQKTENYRSLNIMGRDIKMHVIKTPYFDNKGNIAGILGVGRDVTQTIRQKEQLEKMNDLLQASYNELESFSYSLTHDLQAPIRHIESYTRLLKEDPSLIDTKKGSGFLENILASSSKMADIVDGMMALAGINSAEISKKELNLSVLAESILNEAESRLSREIHYSIEKDIRVLVDAKLIRIVLENLIDNAIKYSNRDKYISIEIAGFQDGNNKGFYIRDNGIGFSDPENRMFQPFQRLVSGSDYKGKGIGLATVLRIIKKHQGQIWAESKPGHGSTFYIVLP